MPDRYAAAARIVRDRTACGGIEPRRSPPSAINTRCLPRFMICFRANTLSIMPDGCSASTRWPRAAGQQVLDIGCGTGLNFSAAPGTHRSSGTDRRDRPQRRDAPARRGAAPAARGWTERDPDPGGHGAAGPGGPSRPASRQAAGAAVSDAALATYSLSLMEDWERRVDEHDGAAGHATPGWPWWTCRTRWAGPAGWRRWRAWRAHWAVPTSTLPRGGPLKTGASTSSVPRPGAVTCRSGRDG